MRTGECLVLSHTSRSGAMGLGAMLVTPMILSPSSLAWRTTRLVISVVPDLENTIKSPPPLWLRMAERVPKASRQKELIPNSWSSSFIWWAAEWVERKPKQKMVSAPWISSTARASWPGGLTSAVRSRSSLAWLRIFVLVARVESVSWISSRRSPGSPDRSRSSRRF